MPSFLTRSSSHPAARRACLALVAAACLLLTARADADDRVVKKPAAGTPEATIAAVLDAGLRKDFDAYVATAVPDRVATDEQRKTLQRYEWARFQKQAPWYVKARKPLTFVIVRQDDGDEPRFFLRDVAHESRMPVPIRLKQTDAGWRVLSSAL